MIAIVVAADGSMPTFVASPRSHPSANAPPHSRGGVRPSWAGRPPTSSADVGPGAPDGTVALVGAGDIASCGVTADSQTARLVESIPNAIVFTAGDNVYQSGTTWQYLQCYGPTWGAFLANTHPAFGNHDLATNGGAPYFAYFGPSSGTPGQGWYSFQAGTWNVIVLNGNCTVVGCRRGSPQLTWLQADLAAHPGVCTLAIWHQPRFTSGIHGNDRRLVPFWQALYSAGADVVINGHDHDYERFVPQTPFGVADPVRGIREFVVGTGGRSLRRFPGRPVANSMVRNASTYGVLRLDLSPGSYTWRFLGVPGSTFSDSGAGVCHRPRPTVRRAATGGRRRGELHQRREPAKHRREAGLVWRSTRWSRP